MTSETFVLKLLLSEVWVVMTQLRAFRFWEQICSTMNISMAFELQGPVTADLVAKAWALIKQEYSYFASTIIQDEYGQLHFKFPESHQVSRLQSIMHIGTLLWI